SRGNTFVDVRGVPGLDEPARLLGLPIDRGGRRLVLVVGATRENRAEALRSLRTELLVAGPFALVLATALGYLLAGAGLRAVEAMRRRAAAISADRPGERLPVPPTGDELERLGTTLNGMLARLESALERERGFVAEAGHELRTPLALLLEQALGNLVGNGLRHGGGKVRLWARLVAGGTVELHVTDRGGGFGEEFLDRAFDRFSRADAGRSGGGAGLGLAIVETIARAH